MGSEPASALVDGQYCILAICSNDRDYCSSYSICLGSSDVVSSREADPKGSLEAPSIPSKDCCKVYLACLCFPV